ncbi:hypothetical protein Tco_0579956, partial [Tanacetum coccineum]
MLIYEVTLSNPYSAATYFGGVTVSKSSSEGTGTVPGVPNEVKGAFEAKADSAIDWGSENKSDYSKEDKVDEEIE